MVEKVFAENNVTEEKELLKKLKTRNDLWAVSIILLSIIPFIIYESEQDCHVPGCLVNNFLKGIAIAFLVIVVILLIIMEIFEIQLFAGISAYNKEKSWLNLKTLFKYIIHAIEANALLLMYIILITAWNDHTYTIHNLYHPYLLILMSSLQLFKFLIERKTIRKILKIHERKKVLISPINMLVSIIICLTFQIISDLLYHSIGLITKVKVLFIFAFVFQNYFVLSLIGLNIEQVVRWKRNNNITELRKTLFKNEEFG